MSQCPGSQHLLLPAAGGEYVSLRAAFGEVPGFLYVFNSFLVGGASISAYGAWYTLALAVGATWLAVVLIIDAVISPAGTGIVYLGTTARLSYALGDDDLAEGITRLQKLFS